jgi:hypothetical protein
MSQKKFDDFFNLLQIEEKIFKFKSMYHPDLISNLSKEGYDLYSVRTSIADQLLEEIKNSKRNLKTVKNFIIKKVKEIEHKRQETKDEMQLKFIDLSLEEWRKFL